MLGESHSVHHEFPEHHDLIEKLMHDDMHFKRLADEYNALDKEIRSIEINNSPVDDTTATEMKMRRGHLKDEIYQIITKNT